MGKLLEDWKDVAVIFSSGANLPPLHTPSPPCLCLTGRGWRRAADPVGPAGIEGRAAAEDPASGPARRTRAGQRRPLRAASLASQGQGGNNEPNDRPAALPRSSPPPLGRSHRPGTAACRSCAPGSPCTRRGWTRRPARPLAVLAHKGSPAPSRRRAGSTGRPPGGSLEPRQGGIQAGRLSRPSSLCAK